MRTRKFTVEICTSNDAFDGEQLEQELARILRDIALDVEYGATKWGTNFALMDINGNRVGKFYTTPG